MLISNTMGLRLAVGTVYIKPATNPVLRTIYWYTIMGSHLTAIFVNKNKKALDMDVMNVTWVISQSIALSCMSYMSCIDHVVAILEPLLRL